MIFRRIVLLPQAGTTRAFGTLKATRRIVAAPRRASAVLPTVLRTALPTTLIRLGVLIIARRGLALDLILAPHPIPVAVALTRHRQETRLPTTAVMRRRSVPIPHRRTPTRRRRRAVPTPPPAALTRLLAAAMEAVVGLLTAAAGVQRHMVAAVVAGHNMAAEVVVAVAPIVKSRHFLKARLSNEAGLFCLSPRPIQKPAHNSLLRRVLNK